MWGEELTMEEAGDQLGGWEGNSREGRWLLAGVRVLVLYVMRNKQVNSILFKIE